MKKGRHQTPNWKFYHKKVKRKQKIWRVSKTMEDGIYQTAMNSERNKVDLTMQRNNHKGGKEGHTSTY